MPFLLPSQQRQSTEGNLFFLFAEINLIDTQLHRAMHLISGCLQPTQLSWLPVRSYVAPPSLLFF